MPINAIFGWLMRKRISQIDEIRNNPLVVQDAVFNTLIRTAESTEWGLAHNYSNIETYEQFKAVVPIQDYEDVKPYIERAIEGEENILWPGQTSWFAKSSGTTSDRSKYIPVTKDSLEGCHYKGGKDLLAMYYENYPDANLYAGKHLVIGGSSILNDSGKDSYTGDLSAIIVRNLPWWAEIKRTPSREIALMSDWEPKIELMAQETKDEDVCILTGVPSWTLVLAHRILEITGKKNLKEVWPNLELFMHGGVNFEPYRAEFNKIIPDGSMHYVESYNASEGIFGMQDLIGEKDLLLMVDYGIFYEFIPMDQYDGVNSKEIIALKDVELAKNYAVVISTNGGLWRYILGDTIQFSNLSPYRFKITGRTKSFINAFGEELVVDNAEQAIAHACEQSNSSIVDYTASPIYMKFADDGNKGQHEWLIEFLNAPSEMDKFAAALDQKLREVNSDYDAKRTKDIALLGPKITVVPKGTFNDWLKSKGKLGGQHKVPRLSNNREFVEQILNLI